MSAAWDKCLQHLRTVFSEQDLNRHLGSIRVEEMKDKIVLLAPNQDLLQEVQESLLSRIEAFFRDYENPAREVSLRMAPAPAEVLPHAPEAEHYRNLLSRRFTFDYFVSGPSSALAERASRDIAEAPGGTSPNPLFISGGHGLGKTHLLQAIAHRIQDRAPQAKVLYIHGERFVEDAIRAMRSRSESKLDAFKKFYRGADVLLVDDIWVLERTPHCQQEFLHTLNALFARNAQVILAASRLPHELGPSNGQDPALKARLSGGLHVVINPPDFDTCVHILLQKAEERKVELSVDVAEYIAKNIRGSVRELENALVRVHMQALCDGGQITLQCARGALQGCVRPRTVSLREIQTAICKLFGCTGEQLCSQSRRRSIVRPRQVAMTLAADLTNMSLADIGEAFGGRDHSTVVYARNKIRSSQESDPDTWSQYRQLSRDLLH